MKDRIKRIVEQSGLTRTSFAKRINVTQGFISQICSGLAKPSDRTISDICREFGCNEIWLRTGEGDPFQQETRQEQIMRFAVQTINGSDEFKKSFVSMLAQMDAEDWEALARIFDKFTSEQKKSE